MILQNLNNIRVDIYKYYFSVDGVLLDNSVIPSSLQTKLPWFLFGKFDYDCNYRNISHILNPEPWAYIGVYNRAELRFLFSGFNNFQSVMQNGDMSLLFTDSVINPSYYALVVLSSQGSALTGIIQNAEFQSPYFDLQSNNPLDDYLEDILFLEISQFGTAARFDRLPIAQYYTPMTRPLNEKLGINIEVKAIAQNVLGSYINFNTTDYYVDFRRINY